ncbi:MAG: cyclic lactone autoinducer peptide [Lachnospiraceae bacterium]|nr:cyclic lactone autoinducer peptide [Lachnospiraceae bacterium]
MGQILGMVAKFIALVAETGAGFLSMGIGYQPEIPEELKQ